VPPRLLTFDVFGTVLDWRRGLSDALAARGRALGAGEFDRVVDLQGELEQRPPFRTYREIAASSLVEALGLDAAAADEIARDIGHWPPYPDSPPALRRLLAVAPCVATTNSDRAHGAQVQAALGLRLSSWICAEDVRCYKPDPRFWREVSARTGVALGPDWWHVSAYADYDGSVASSLGLTAVYVDRPHARRGPAGHEVKDLGELAALVERAGA
jgi:2-haloacid dehalogenase